MRRETSIVGAALAAVCLVILGSSALCAWVIAEGASPRWRLLFRMLCHGLASRSFELFGAAMPICARCTGIYLGLLGALAVFALWQRVISGNPGRGEDSSHSSRLGMTLFLFLAAAPMAIDGLSQATGLRESTNALRVGTGLVAAFAFGLWALSELEGAVNRRLSGA